MNPITHLFHFPVRGLNGNEENYKLNLDDYPMQNPWSLLKETQTTVAGPVSAFSHSLPFSLHV